MYLCPDDVSVSLPWGVRTLQRTPVVWGEPRGSGDGAVPIEAAERRLLTMGGVVLREPGDRCGPAPPADRCVPLGSGEAVRALRSSEGVSWGSGGRIE